MWAIYAPFCLYSVYSGVKGFLRACRKSGYTIVPGRQLTSSLPVRMFWCRKEVVRMEHIITIPTLVVILLLIEAIKKDWLPTSK